MDSELSNTFFCLEIFWGGERSVPIATQHNLWPSLNRRDVVRTSRMGHLNKRARQLMAARDAKKRLRTLEEEEPEPVERTPPPFSLHDAHWEGISSDEDESDIEISEVEDNILEEASLNAFEMLLSSRKKEASSPSLSTKFLYQRGPELSDRQQRRIRATKRDLLDTSKIHSQPITRFFAPTIPRELNEPQSHIFDQNQLRQIAINDLEKKLNSKKTVLAGQNLTRHRAVLQLLRITQLRQEGETREELSYSIARSFNKGRYFARCIVEWEGMWRRERQIPEGKRGCHAKINSWFNDEGVQIAVREWCASAGDSKSLSSKNIQL